MKRLIIITIILLVLVFIGVILFHIYRSQKAALFFPMEKNDNSSIMIIDNLTLNRNLHPDIKIKVSASIAYVDRNKESVKLENCYISYKKGNREINVGAKECLYVEDKNFILKRKVKGKINNVVFLTGDNGILEFFIEDGYGSVKNGVHIIENSNSISANRLDIYKRSKELYFQGNVRAIYEK